MADKTLTELPSQVDLLSDDDSLYVVLAGNSRKKSWEEIRNQLNTELAPTIDIQGNSSTVGEGTALNFISSLFTFALVGDTVNISILDETLQDFMAAVLTAAEPGDIKINYDDTLGQLYATLKPLLIVPVTLTTHSIPIQTRMSHYRYTHASGCTVTIPKNSTLAVPIGQRSRMTQMGAAAVTLVPEDGTVTLNSRNNAYTSAGLKAVFEVEKVGTNEWDVLGDVI